jgi:hypothetical protein
MEFKKFTLLSKKNPFLQIILLAIDFIAMLPRSLFRKCLSAECRVAVHCHLLNLALASWLVCLSTFRMYFLTFFLAEFETVTRVHLD